MLRPELPPRSTYTAQPPPVRAAMLEGARQNMPLEAFRLLEGALVGLAA